jgi:hypothetical protein
MQHFPINYLALFVATVARMIVGMLWYSPLLFRNAWIKLSGRTPEQEKEGGVRDVIAGLIGSFIMAFVLVHAVHYAGARSIGQGAGVAFFNWLGFIVVPAFASTVHEKKSFKLFSIHLGFQLVSLLVMGAIVAIWT